MVPVGPHCLSVFEEAGILLLADGGLRPGAPLWIADGIALSRGFNKPELGCLDPKEQHKEETVWISKR